MVTPRIIGVGKLQQVLKMCVGILIRLATKRASLHRVDEAGLEFKVHVPTVNVGSSSHIGGRGDGELAESLLNHSLTNSWCL